MSVKIMSAVWDLQLPDSEKIVLLALADCANDEGHCWPGMKSLTRKCSKSERTIQGAVQSLVDKGHLTRREVFGKGCNYTVHPRSDCAPAATAPPQGTTQTPAAAAGKPSKKHHTSTAKAVSGSRAKPKISYEQAFPTEDEQQKFAVLCVQWAVGELRWRPGDARGEFARFIDRNQSVDGRYSGWLAAWRKWCRNDFCSTAKQYEDATAYRRGPIRG